MTYDDLIILIPSHSLEDFPTELAEEQAASLLNAFAAPWHPILLAQSGVIPSWHRADSPPETLENRLILVPTVCNDWLPGGWVGHARKGGAVVVADVTDRDEMVRAALEPLQSEQSVDPDLAADFLALGTSYLQIELLTRHMHHFSNLDEVHLQREAIAAAQAALAGDTTAAKTHLRTCFEVLTEARERFYPVDCYLFDLCLVIPRLADEHFEKTLTSSNPVNVLMAGDDLAELAESKPALIETMRNAWEEKKLDVLGGERRESAVPLLPLESLLWEFREGHNLFRQLFGRTPKTWARRRYGFSTQLPQILTKSGYHSALHLALDDGLYPDAEQSKIRWEGCDTTVIDAITRIPLAAESATSYLRFSQRMAESMEEDHVAGLMLARWPEINSPWFDDLRRMQQYSPCLGRFVTLDDFFQNTDTPGRLSTFEERQYLTPFLIHAVARREENPISRFSEHFRRRRQFDSALWYRAVSRLLAGKAVDEAEIAQHEQTIEAAGPDGTAESSSAAEEMLTPFTAQSVQQLADVVMQRAGDEPGFLILNPMSFSRRMSVSLPDLLAPPSPGGAVKAVQFDDKRKFVTVEVPGSGFAWVPARGGEAEKAATSSTPTAEDFVLRNEFFEVYLNEETGGIRQIKNYGRSPNRLSQQLAFRFPRERTVVVGDDEETAEEIKTPYSEMRCLGAEVTCSGPALGEIVTRGEIVDQMNNERLAGFQQTFRVWRGRRVVEIDVELDVERMPEENPWMNYYAARFAWNDSTAALTRSVLEGAHGFDAERFESPHYFEIAADDQRTTILNFGIPFHRKTGPRMLDSLMIVAGESKRRFRFAVAIDEPYPMQAALDAMTPVTAVPTKSGPPAFGKTGWFFHLPEKNVQMTRVMGLQTIPPTALEPWEEHDYEASPSGEGFAVRLLETEGRPRQVHLRCFRTPTSARQRDFQGRTIADLKIEDDCVLIDLTRFEIADVEIRFDTPNS